MYSLMTFPNSSIDSKLRFLSIYLFEHKSRYSQKSWKIGSITFQVQNVCRRNRTTQYTIKLPDFKKKKCSKFSGVVLLPRSPQQYLERSIQTLCFAWILSKMQEPFPNHWSMQNFFYFREPWYSDGCAWRLHDVFFGGSGFYFLSLTKTKIFRLWLYEKWLLHLLPWRKLL